MITSLIAHNNLKSKIKWLNILTSSVEKKNQDNLKSRCWNECHNPKLKALWQPGHKIDLHIQYNRSASAFTAGRYL